MELSHAEGPTEVRHALSETEAAWLCIAADRLGAEHYPSFALNVLAAVAVEQKVTTDFLIGRVRRQLLHGAAGSSSAGQTMQAL